MKSINLQLASVLKIPVKKVVKSLKGRLKVNFSENIGVIAQTHCLFGREDVAPIRGKRLPLEVNEFRSWRNENYLNVEAHYADRIFNCVFEPAELRQEVYVPLTHELVTWLAKDQFGIIHNR